MPPDMPDVSTPDGSFRGTDIWYVDLSGGARNVTRHEATLSREERSRAGGFRFERDAIRYIVAHGALRNILARYLGRDALDIAFSFSTAGKPALTMEGDSAGIRFNLTHSDDLALVAVAKRAEVGIDVERINTALDLPSIARSCFSRGERDRLRCIRSSQYAEEFFAFWTRKEAYVKGIGHGLSAPLSEIDISESPAFPGGGWFVCDIQVPPIYRGAIATASSAAAFRSFRYDNLPL